MRPRKTRPSQRGQGSLTSQETAKGKEVEKDSVGAKDTPKVKEAMGGFVKTMGAQREPKKPRNPKEPRNPRKPRSS